MGQRNEAPTIRPPVNELTAEELEEQADQWDADARAAEAIPSSYRTRAQDLRRMAENLRNGS